MSCWGRKYWNSIMSFWGRKYQYTLLYSNQNKWCNILAVQDIGFQHFLCQKSFLPQKWQFMLKNTVHTHTKKAQPAQKIAQLYLYNLNFFQLWIIWWFFQLAGKVHTKMCTKWQSSPNFANFPKHTKNEGRGQRNC